MAVVELTAETFLSDLPLKGSARVTNIDDAGPMSARLESLGICVGRTLRLVKTGELFIVNVYGSRLGIAREVAKLIKVTPDAQ